MNGTMRLKTKYADPFEQRPESVSTKKQSKFNFLFNQALQQVKRKISHEQQNLPLLKLKSYQNVNHSSQKLKNQAISSQLGQKLNINPLIRHKSINAISARYSTSPKKPSVNKILWEKKMSLETLRISSTKRPSKTSIPKQLSKQSVKHLRQKTSTQPKDFGQDEQYNAYSHMSITPLNILSSKQERQRYLMKKKNVQNKLKMTFFNEKDKVLDRKINLDFKNDGLFKNKIGQVDHDQDEFINFVKQKTNITYRN